MAIVLSRIAEVAVKFASRQDIEAVKASELFDEKWYLSQYPDVALLEMDAAEHFLWVGWRLNRSPSAKFCVPSYLDSNPDVAHARFNPLLHYIRHGVNENRPIYPLIPNGEKEARVLVRRILTRRHVDWDETAGSKFVAELQSVKHNTEASFISIIMPTKNRSRTIRDAILSVLNQSHRNLELIIIDDGGSDDTQSVISKLNDGRIRYLKQEVSGGVSKARNIGLSAARGEWIFFLDSDNTWHREMVELGLKHAFRRQVSAGYCAADLLDDARKRKAVLYADFDYESCVRENYIDLNCFFMRWEGEFRKLRFDEDLKRLVDWDFVLKVASHTRVAGAPYIGVNYYDGSNDRISNQEHRNNIMELVTKVRKNALAYGPAAEPILDRSSYRIAVVLHVFHPEAVEGCISYLKNIECDFDLYVTTSLELSDPCIQLLLTSFPAATVFRFPNHGADIAPFLELITTLKNYALVCKIHTKRDAGKWGSAWRRELLNSVLESPAHVRNVIEHFKKNSQLAVVCSKSLYKDGRKNSIPETLKRTLEISELIGIDERALKGWGFVAGTMFWIRPKILLPLATHMCNSAGYSKVFRQDGAIEHAIERALGIVVSATAHAMVGLAEREQIEVLPAISAMTDEGVSVTMARMVVAE